jgi:hypothetical protein
MSQSFCYSDGELSYVGVAGEYSVMVIDLLGKYYKICSTTAVQGFL